jgi:KUP system potassium uptake protein
VPGNFFRIHVRQGFDDEVINDLGSMINDRLYDFLMRSTSHGVANGLYSDPQDQGENSRTEIDACMEAFKTQVVYIVGTERLRVADTTGFFRRLVLRAFIWLRGLSRSKIAQMKLPYDKLFEVGIFKDI